MTERNPVVFLLEKEIAEMQEELARSETGIASWNDHILREQKRIDDITSYIGELQDALDKIRNGSL